MKRRERNSRFAELAAPLSALFDKAAVISGSGKTVLPVDGAFVAVVENGKISYYSLPEIIENVVVSCGRFMLDQSEVQEPPQPVDAAGTLLRDGFA